jgi:SOS-response transcriptional repressor LexA
MQGAGDAVTKKPPTVKQGQYLAFIFYYTKIHGVPPAESDMQHYFKVSPPSVHQMVVLLEANRYIERIPGQGRSIRLLVPRKELPDLEYGRTIMAAAKSGLLISGLLPAI